MDIKEGSIFASDLVTLGGGFQILLGGRQIWYRARQLSATALPQSKDAFVPSIAGMFRPAPDIMTYVSYSRGLEAGEYAPYTAKNANEPTPPITSDQVEAGVKASIDHRFDLGIALFSIRRDASYLNTNNDYVSSGRFRHRGVEVSATARPIAGLTLSGNVAYLDTRLIDVIDPTTLGKRSQGVPRWTSVFRARYAFASLPGLSIDGIVSHVGRRPVDAQNSGFIPGYTVGDAGLTYTVPLDHVPLTLRLYGRNLTNAYYYASAAYERGLGLGRPRELFLSGQIRF